MLTGDAQKVGEQVAAELGINTVYSELLPADKVAKVEELLAAQTGNGWLCSEGILKAKQQNIKVLSLCRRILALRWVQWVPTRLSRRQTLF